MFKQRDYGNAFYYYGTKLLLVNLPVIRLYFNKKKNRRKHIQVIRLMSLFFVEMMVMMEQQQKKQDFNSWQFHEMSTLNKKLYDWWYFLSWR